MATADRRLTTPRPDPLDGVTDCPDCRARVDSTPYLVAAVASVAISRGTSSEQTLRRYLDDHHQRGHRSRGKISDGGGGE